MGKTRVFLICPVRKTNPEVQAKIGAYVKSLESNGCQVHWPPRDTNQDDPIGINISAQNGTAILAADEVHIWHDPVSEGSVFDLGILFSRFLRGNPPKFIIANPGEVIPTPHKSRTNIILALAQH